MTDTIKILLSDPTISAAVTFVGTLVAAKIKQWFDLRSLRTEEEEKLAREQLRLKTMEVTGRIEMLSEQRKALGFAPTPTETKFATAQTELRDLGYTPAAARDAIEYVLPYVREQAKQVVARSILPPTHGQSGEHPTVMPPRSPTGFSNDKTAAVRVDPVTGDVLTLDDSGDPVRSKDGGATWAKEPATLDTSAVDNGDD